MLKKFAGISLVAVLTIIASAPETYGGHGRHRGRRAVVAGRTYYNPYYLSGNRGRYYSPYYQARSRSRFDGRFFERRNRGGIGSTGRALLTIGAPAAIAAGVGALVGGKKGAAVGALLGGGGGAAYYLLRNRRRR